MQAMNELKKQVFFAIINPNTNKRFYIVVNWFNSRMQNGRNFQFSNKNAGDLKSLVNRAQNI